MANSKVLIEVIATSKGLKVVAKDTEQLVKSTKKLDNATQQSTKTTQKHTTASINLTNKINLYTKLTYHLLKVFQK